MEPRRLLAADLLATITEFGNVAVAGSDTIVLGQTGFREDPSDQNSPRGRVQLYDLRSGDLLRTLDDPAPASTSSFGQAVAGLGEDRVIVSDPGFITNDFDNPQELEPARVYVFDIETGALISTLEDPATSPVRDGEFFRFGATVAALGTDRILVGTPRNNVVHLFDASSGELLRTFDDPGAGTFEPAFGLDSPLVPLGGNRFAAGERKTYVFDADTGAVNSFSPNDSFEINDMVALGEDRLAIATDGVVKVFDLAGNLLATAASPDGSGFGGFGGFGASLATASPDRLLAGGARDNAAIGGNVGNGAVYVIDAESLQVLDVIPNPRRDAEFPGQLVAGGGLFVATSTLFDPNSSEADPFIDVFEATTPLLLAGVDGAARVNGSTVDFGRAGLGQASPTRDVLLTNPSSSPRTLTLSTPQGFTRVGGTGSTVALPAGGSTTLTLGLSDTATSGPRDGVMRLSTGGELFALRLTGDVFEGTIPDAGTFTSTRTISGSTGTVGDVNVTLKITHPDGGGLSAFLISPAGTRVELFSNLAPPDGSGSGEVELFADFGPTTFDDDVAVQTGTGPFDPGTRPRVGAENTGATPPYSSRFQPEGGAVLTQFDDEVADGVWTLEVTDGFGNDVTGTLDTWSLQLRAKGLRFYSGDQLLDEFTSVSFNTDQAPLELTGDPGPTLQFFLQNDGNIPLAVGQLTPPVDSFGTHGFTLADGPAPGTILQPGERAPFIVQQLFFDDGGFGDQLRMDGSDERFVVTGSVSRPVGRPEIGLFRNPTGQPITNNHPAAVDFGSVPQGEDNPSVAFSLRNLGADPNGALSVSNLQLPAGFTILTADGRPFDRTLQGDDTGVMAFNLVMSSKTGGDFAGEVRFTTNDADEAPFVFKVRGTVTSQGTVVVPPAEPEPVVPPPSPPAASTPEEPAPTPEPPPTPVNPNGLAVTSISQGKFIGPFIAGDKKAKGSVAVSFAFIGNEARGAGPATLELYLSLDDKWDAQDQRIGSSTKSILVKDPKPAKPGKPQKLPKAPKAAKLKVAIPFGTPPGTYRLIARMTGSRIANDGTSVFVGSSVVVQ